MVDRDAPTEREGPGSAEEHRIASEAGRKLVEVDPARYQLGNEVARGGMGRIRTARDLRLGREVAIKELLEPSGTHAVRFEREALVTARLQHPAIVAVYEAGRWPTGEPFYAMRIVHGRSLRRVIVDAKQLEARIALLPHVIAVADAMAYAHDQRIIHRDLKPSNVLVGGFGETVVIDWGLAKDLVGADDPPSGPPSRPSNDPMLTTAGAVMGTPSYMPPEQARGETVDERADVYAIGAILYHLLSGAAPYAGEARQVLAKVVIGPPAPLERRVRALAPDLVAIVERAMSRDPDARYRNAGELAEELRRFQSGRLVASHRYTLGELVRRFVRRHRLALGVGTVAAIALAVVGVISVQSIRVERDDAARQRELADRQRATASERADQLAVAQARRLVSTDPAGALKLLAELSPGSPQWSAARIIASDARAAGVPKKASLDRAQSFTSVVASADGSQFATATDTGAVLLWDATALTYKAIGSHNQRYAYVHGLSGSRLVTSSYDLTVGIWDLADGAAPILLPHPGPVRIAAISEDGRALVSNADDDHVRIWDVSARKERASFAHGAGFGGLAIARDGRVGAWSVNDGPAHVLDIEAGTDRVVEPGFATSAFALSRDGASLAVAGSDGTLIVLGLRDKSRRVLGHVPKDPITSMAFSSDGTMIASIGSSTHDLLLWSTSGGTPRRLGGSETSREPPVFSPDGKQLAVGGDFPGVWDLASGVVKPLRAPTVLANVAFVRGSERVVATPITGNTLWSWPTAHEERVVARVKSPARQVAVLPDGKVIAVGDGELVIDGQRRALEGGIAGRVAIAPDGRSLAVIGTDDRVRVLDLASGAARTLEGTHRIGARAVPSDPVSTWARHTGSDTTNVSAIVRRQSRAELEEKGWVDHMRFSPDGATLAAYFAQGGDVAVWAVATGARHVVHTGSADIEDLVFSRDGRTLYAGSSDNRILAIAVATSEVEALPGHEAPIEALALSPDGQTLASAGTDRVVDVLRMATRANVAGCTHGQAAGKVAFVPDGSSIISAGDDGTICIYDVARGQARVLAAHHEAVVLALAVAPDGKSLATSATDGGVRIWDLATGEYRETAVIEAMAGELAFSRDGKTLYGAISDGSVRAWQDDLPHDEASLRAWIAAALR
jgi:WD40 repeat protein